MASVESRIIAVTGGASGIGAATCCLLAERGASVICIGDASSAGLDNIKETIGRINPTIRVECTVLDVTSPTQVEQWMASIISSHQNLHGAANIAGIAQGAGLRQAPTILEETDEAWANIMKVNLDGVFYCTRAAVRAMKELPPGDRSIVNVASIAAFRHMPDVFAYATSKSACAYFTTCVAADVSPLGIRANTVSPGITNTPMLPQFHPNLRSLQEIQESYRKEGFSTIGPEEVARTIVWLLSEDSSPVYGANINVGACVA
ncbi:short chain dehydrogenase/oxidoreductase CpoX2 [Xylaria telfairii]|nr:short chain dehydrogenase/oxidoreductase CpoX2 [Xylaria telfairii]